MAKTIPIDQLAKAVTDALNEYSNVCAEDMKVCIQDTAKQVQKDIKSGAPARTGKYKKSWANKKTAESSTGLQVTVYSRNRYQLAHLLEKGHAKRNGGRVQAYPHIAPAEQAGNEKLLNDIQKKLSLS